MRSLVCALLFVFICPGLSALDAEQSRILVHTLNYLGHDYQFAVKNGKIINEAEYREQLDFSNSTKKYFAQYSPTWSNEDSSEIGILILRLDSLIVDTADVTAVANTALEAKNRVVTASGLVITPNKYPNPDNGKIIYKTACAKCHGGDGYGDGPDGKDLDPKPRNLRDAERMNILSPFTIFNTVRLGVEGTGMKPHPTLSDEEVWDVAFYVASLRYKQYQSNPLLKKESLKGLVDSLSLGVISSLSDEELLRSPLLAQSGSPALVLAAVRLKHEAPRQSQFLNTSLKYLQGAMELYLQGKYSDASQLAALAYLEGIEPVEMQLKATDPGLTLKLEGQMQSLRRLMEESHPLMEVNDSLTAVRLTIAEAGEILNNKNYSFLLALLMAASVLLREGLEAFLVIMVILSILKVAQIKNSETWVHAGWIGAVLVGIALWFAGGKLMNEQLQHVELVEGTISFVAVGMLLYVGFWLHGKSEINRWRDYVSRMMKGVVGKESLWGLGALSFFVVFREVFESVLFLSALNMESGGKQGQAILMGVIAAFLLVLILAYIFLKFTTKLPIPKLFKISSLVMGVLAVVLSGKGIHSFQEIGLIPIHGIPMYRAELLGIFPTLETCTAQLGALLIVAAIWRLTQSKK